MADTTWETEHLTAVTIEAANDNGIKLEGRAAWVNFGKNNPLPAYPEVGYVIDAVVITNAQGRSYLKSWKDADPEPLALAAAGVPLGRPPRQQQLTTTAPVPQASTVPPAPAGNTSTRPIEPRDLCIARMSALKSAVKLAAADEATLPTSTILAVADELLAWIVQES